MPPEGYDYITPDLSEVPFEYLLKEIARRSNSALLAVNWRTQHGIEAHVYAHGRRVEILGLHALSGEAIAGNDAGALSTTEDFPNPPDLVKAKPLRGPGFGRFMN